ncbi:chromosomal replication initiator DnaA [Roseomonas sp. CCTCC AB2023176]|uniref:chromosomal replication initiator DnaA n=1 Tax=Roseomonas sp. CCTCC AB2023176 TaxID=3342640 RepID=UPI0035DAFCDD
MTPRPVTPDHQTPIARQLPLPLAVRPEPLADPIPDPSNAVVRTWLADPLSWPFGRLAIHGPEGCGKSAYLAQAARRLELRILRGAELRGLPPAGPTALDDADLVPDEAALFHLINACAEGGHLLLLVGRAAPSRWPVRLPDLASRLRATSTAEVEQPSESLLRALLTRQFSARQLRIEPALVYWLLARLPREAAVLSEVAARLDRAAMADGRAITRALARATLADLLEPHAEDHSADDDSVARRPPPPPVMGTLL